MVSPSHNEQPWSYLVATQENPEQFQQLLSCFTERNQIWAKNAPVLALVQVPPSDQFSEGDVFRVREVRASYGDSAVASGTAEAARCAVRYLQEPFQREPDFGVTSVNYD